MEGEIFILVGLILDCAGALFIATPLLNLVKEIELKTSPLLTRDSKGNTVLAENQPKKNSAKTIILDRFHRGPDALTSDERKQSMAKGGIILLVIGFLSQIVGNILS